MPIIYNLSPPAAPITPDLDHSGASTRGPRRSVIHGSDLRPIDYGFSSRVSTLAFRKKGVSCDTHGDVVCLSLTCIWSAAAVPRDPPLPSALALSGLSAVNKSRVVRTCPLRALPRAGRPPAARRTRPSRRRRRPPWPARRRTPARRGRAACGSYARRWAPPRRFPRRFPRRPRRPPRQATARA